MTNPAQLSGQIYLLMQLVKRDVILRYRGAMFGALWVLINPLVTLAILAFVVGGVFRTRWPQQQAAVAPFWVVLYSGLIAFNIFAETVSRAPGSVRNYPNFVKKIIFPVGILPLVPLGTALVHAAFNFLILLIALAWVGQLHLRVALYPITLLPMVAFALAMSWFFAAWGVFIKDMSQIVPPFIQMLMFLSPVLYPASAVPSLVQPFYRYNPIGVGVEACRSAALGLPVDWQALCVSLFAGVVIAGLGLAFFAHSREEFADAL